MLDLQKSYHLAFYSGAVESPTGDVRLNVADGDLDLATAGTVSGSIDVYETNATGTTATAGSPIAWLYNVLPDGRLVLDLDPMNPGTDETDLWIAPDGAIMHGARSGIDTDAFCFLAIEKGSGLGNATLSGTYEFVAQRLELDAAGELELTIEFGSAVFDGAGGASFSALSIVQGTSGSSTSGASGTGTYSVASDGAVVLGSEEGAVSADGDLLMIVTDGSGGRAGLAIAVRSGTSYNFGDLAGRYSLGALGFEVGAAATLPRADSTFGDLALVASGTSAGSYAVDGVAVESRPQGVTSSPSAFGGAATLGSTGALALQPPGGTIEVWVSSNLRYYVGNAAVSGTNQWFGTRLCAEAMAVGSGTAGSGGVVPVLGMKRFPTLGNGAFGFAVADALGGGLAVLAVSAGSAPGLPLLGGQIWIDPGQIGVLAALVLGGPLGAAGAGAGTVGLPIPNAASIVGFELWGQAIVLDPAGPGGFALSNGFKAVVCD